MWVGPTSSESRKSGHRPILSPIVDPVRVPTIPHGGDPPGSPGLEKIIDLSLSTNPYGPPPFLWAAMKRATREVGSYPDREQKELTERLRSELHVDRREILVGGSASELIRCTLSAYAPGRSVFLPRYTYEEFRRVALSVGARVRILPMPRFRLSPERMMRDLKKDSLIILTNPGTPNGQYLSPLELSPMVDEVERRGALLVVDESYLPFVEAAESMTHSSPNVLVLFSWSKVLGAPGLPLGHAVGDPNVLAGLKSHLLPWSIGPFSRHIALLTLEDGDWVLSTLKCVRQTAATVREQLRSPSQANYFMVRSRSARTLTRSLLLHGYRVRDLSSMGLPRHIRFAVRAEPETMAFLRCLKDEVPEGTFSLGNLE